MVLLQVGHAAIRPSIWTIHAPEGHLGDTRAHDTRPCRVTTYDARALDATIILAGTSGSRHYWRLVGVRPDTEEPGRVEWPQGSGASSRRRGPGSLGASRGLARAAGRGDRRGPWDRRGDRQIADHGRRRGGRGRQGRPHAGAVLLGRALPAPARRRRP